MTNCEKLYTYYAEHPKATTDEVMTALDWERRQVTRYKHRLKTRGFVDVDPVDSDPIHEYKQDAYRQAADACLDRMHAPETTIPQMIELIRELRMILKEITAI